MHELICGSCHKIMDKVESGIKIQCESMSGVQAGDKYECKYCGQTIFTKFGSEYGFYNVEPDIHIESAY